MQPDDHLCLCFHVTRRKVENFVRIERPAAPSMLSECGGAGTGCGWCRPFLKKLWEAGRARGEACVPPANLPTAEDYASGRGNHIRSGGGSPPPGAEPTDC